MISVCSRTFKASGSPPRLVASFIMTEIGVFNACARLPTWVRARVTISRLASMSALVSRASGAISTGKAPSSRSAVPERMAARPSEMRLSGAKPKRTWKVVVSNRTTPRTAKVMTSAPSKLLVLGPFGVTLPRAARRRRGAEVGEMRQRRVPQRAGRAHIGRRRVEPRHLPIPAGERQIEQRLADRLGKLAGVLLRSRDVGDQGAQVDAQPSVERTLHRRAIDRRQHNAGDDEDHHGPSRCREEQPKGERIKTHCPVERADSRARARSG